MKGYIKNLERHEDSLKQRIEQLEAENAKLKKSIGRNFDWVEIDGERVYTSYDQKLREENAKLRGALKSIASNTCCEPCQEAALVARQALLEGKE